MSANQKKYTPSKYHWLIYSQAFLKMADVGIKELAGKKYDKKGPDSYLNYDDYKYFLIPILWNLKHAIELIVKTLQVSITQKYLTGHNLSSLNQAFQIAVKEFGIQDRFHSNI